MTEDLIKFAFSAGELSPHLHGRPDVEKFDLGLAEAYNFFVDYRGGASTRPGTRFGEFVQHNDKPARIIRFRFNTEVANTYLLVFTENRLRFAQSGGYVVEAGINVIDITQTNPGVVTTSAAHSYTTGDWVYINDIVGMPEATGRIIQVGATTADTFEMLDHRGNNLDTTGFTAYSSGGNVTRVHTVVSPFAPEDLAKVKYHQRKDEVAFTHPDYPVQILTRLGATSWTLVEETFGTSLASPGQPTLTPSAAGTAGYGVVVTAVDANNVESLPSRAKFTTTSVDFTATAGSVTVTWTAVSGAVKYNIYRTRVFPTGTEVTYAEQFGFAGTSFGPRFVDSNIVLDFSQSPPKHLNPFADGTVTSISITAPGAGYVLDDTVTVTGATSGTGFVGYPIVDNAGTILGVVIIDGGKDYDTPLTITFSGGAGATATGTVSAATGNNPAAVTVFSQRRQFGGTTNAPLDIWGSKVLDFNNLDVSDTPNAGDSFNFTLDSDGVEPVRHLMAARNGMLVFTKTELALVRGEDSKALSAVSAEADNQVAPGASHVAPLFINGGVLYYREKGSGVLHLTYNGFSRSFEVEDIATLSGHLFEPDLPAVSSDYEEHPFKLVWHARNDGQMLALTFLPDQKVVAWTRCATKGLVEGVVTIEEDGLDVTYLLVRRFINGGWDRMFEFFMPRAVENVEDAWAVDSGLRLEPTFPAATLTPAASDGTGVTFTASASVFTSGNVGDYIRVGGGKVEIKTFVSGTEVTGDFELPMTNVVQEDPNSMPVPAESGEWTLDTPVTSVSGLWHLEGETVDILADGNVKTSVAVTNGAVSWTGAATRVTVGLNFDAHLKTLPISAQGVTIEGKRKSVKGVVVRTLKTRGLSLGESMARLFEMKDRSTEQWGDPTRTRSDMQEVMIHGGFDENGQFFLAQRYPLPATILGYVAEVDLGDTEG